MYLIYSGVLIAVNRFSYICVCVLFHFLFHCGLSQDIEYSRTSLPTLHLHLLIPNSQCIPPSALLSLGNHKSILYGCQSVSVF